MLTTDTRLAGAPGPTCHIELLRGWKTIDVDSPMWALPGYGDDLEELKPGMRARMRQMGLTEDVVAAIMPRHGEPARWSITFAVDDVDAVATRARELAGSVLTEPWDAPWTRSAVLADPADPAGHPSSPASSYPRTAEGSTRRGCTAAR